MPEGFQRLKLKQFEVPDGFLTDADFDRLESANRDLDESDLEQYLRWKVHALNKRNELARAQRRIVEQERYKARSSQGWSFSNAFSARKILADGRKKKWS